MNGSCESSFEPHFSRVEGFGSPMKSTCLEKKFAALMFAAALAALSGCNKASTTDSEKPHPAQTASSSPSADPIKNPLAPGAVTLAEGRPSASAAAPAGAAAETIGPVGPAKTNGEPGTKVSNEAGAPTAVAGGNAKKQYVLPEAMEHYRKAIAAVQNS